MVCDTELNLNTECLPSHDGLGSGRKFMLDLKDPVLPERYANLRSLRHILYTAWTKGIQCAAVNGVVLDGDLTQYHVKSNLHISLPAFEKTNVVMSIIRGSAHSGASIVDNEEHIAYILKDCYSRALPSAAWIRNDELIISTSRRANSVFDDPGASTTKMAYGVSFRLGAQSESSDTGGILERQTGMTCLTTHYPESVQY